MDTHVLEVNLRSLRSADAELGFLDPWDQAGRTATDDEAAEALGIKLRTFQRGWRDARQWLFERLDGKKALRAAQ